MSCLNGVFVFQSTLSMRRATEFRQAWWWPRKFQSTLSMRRATARLVGVVNLHLISIHALHEESDHTVRSANASWTAIFQSTLSMRRATSIRESMSLSNGFQSTLSMRRATFAMVRFMRAALLFQSTLSMRRATQWPDPHCANRLNFNPRSP